MDFVSKINANKCYQTHVCAFFLSALYTHLYVQRLLVPVMFCFATRHSHLIEAGKQAKKKKKHPLMSCCHCDSGWITRHHSPLWKLHLFRRRAREKWDWVLSPQCVSVRTITTCNTRRLTVFCCLTFSFYTNLLPDASTTPVCLNPFLSLPEFAA